ncbi:MAG: hypothetical protein ABSE07_02300 [Methanoregula sp.]|jgi:hypothetical protein
MPHEKITRLSGMEPSKYMANSPIDHDGLQTATGTSYEQVRELRKRAAGVK